MEQYLKALELWRSSPAYVQLAAAFGCSLVGLLMVKGRGGRRRRMSFNSSCMMGTFPKKANVVPPIINILLVLEKCPETSELSERLHSQLMPYDRFRQGLRFSQGNWEFYELSPEKVTVEALARNHIKTSTVKSEAELMQLVDKLVMEENSLVMDGCPVWHVHRIVSSGTGSHAVLFRIHHVIGDGIALVNSMSKIFQDASGKVLDLGIAEKMSGGRSPRGGGDSATTNSKSLLQKVSSIFKLGLDLVASFFAVLSLPASAFDSNTAFLRPNRTDMKMTKRRKTVLLPTMRLSFIKSLKDAAGATVNDVLLSATAGAIRRYCEKVQDSSLRAASSKEPLRARALVPVAFPRPKKNLIDPSKAMQNYWAFASIGMPIAEDSEVARLRSTASTTVALKNSPIVAVQMWVQSYLLPLLPSFLVQQTTLDLFSRHSVVFSNLPGPPDQLFLCGKRLQAVQVVFPNILPQILIISYGGEVFFSMSVDDEAVKTDVLQQCYLEEMRALGMALGVAHNDKTMLSKVSPGGVFGVIGSE